MRVQPPKPLLATLLASSFATMSDLPPEGLAALAWSLAQLQAKPSATWAERYLKCVYQR